MTDRRTDAELLFGVSHEEGLRMDQQVEQARAQRAENTRALVRGADIGSRDVVEWSAGGRTLTLTVDDVLATFVPQNSAVSKKEALFFLQLCASVQANPWLGDAYVIKYDPKYPAAFVIGKGLYLRRATQHPLYDGMESGIMVSANGQVVERRGVLLYDGDKLIGGWARVYAKGRRIPTEKIVELKDYNTGRSQWEKRPAMMINKVAIVQALREAFPDILGDHAFRASETDPDGVEIEYRIDDDPPRNVDFATGEIVDAAPSTPSDAGETPPEPETPSPDAGHPWEGIQSAGDYLTTAQERWGLARNEALRLGGISDVRAVRSWPAAMAQLADAVEAGR